MKVYEHKVQYYETDKMQITHHSNYIRIMEEARIDFLSQIGWGYDKMENEGIISPVVSVTCDYKRSTSFPDMIHVSICVLELSAVKLTLGYTMTVSDKVVCTASSTHCFLNQNGRPISLKKQYPEFYSLLESIKAKNEQENAH